MICRALRLQKRHKNRARAARLAEQVVPARVEGLKRAVCVAVGEKHSLGMQAWCSKPLAAWPFDAPDPELSDLPADNMTDQVLPLGGPFGALIAHLPRSGHVFRC